MTEDEKFVREMWEEITVKTYGNDKPYWIHSQSEYLGNGPFATSEEMWSAAAEFTRTRLAEIRDVEEEIALLNDWKGRNRSWIPKCVKTFSRILAARQAALADLKRGLWVAE